MIMTDADCDGIHIASLIMNFFHFLFPTLLLRKKPFLISMQTPIVKVSIQSKNINFYREENFNDFKLKNKDKRMKIKYYKGLGTSSDKEIKESFGKKVIEYVKDDKADENMNKVFNNKNSNMRKKWAI